MAMEKIGDGLKKILLVGIGAAATTVEKSSQIIDDLVKKGEITVEQGKELNKELQHNVRKTMEARKADAISVEEKLAKMSADELALLKQFAEPLLFSIKKDDPTYYEAKRLLKFLDYFLSLPSEFLPNNSICREFVGGSCFNV